MDAPILVEVAGIKKVLKQALADGDEQVCVSSLEQLAKLEPNLAVLKSTKIARLVLKMCRAPSHLAFQPMAVALMRKWDTESKQRKAASEQGAESVDNKDVKEDEEMTQQPSEDGRSGKEEEGGEDSAMAQAEPQIETPSTSSSSSSVSAPVPERVETETAGATPTECGTAAGLSTGVVAETETTAPSTSSAEARGDAGSASVSSATTIAPPTETAATPTPTPATSSKTPLMALYELSSDSDEDTRPRRGSMQHYECRVCAELLYEPATLHCGHTCCRPCLFKWLKCSSKAKCPAGCTTKIPRKLPFVSIILREKIMRSFPEEYEARKKECENLILQSDLEEYNKMGEDTAVTVSPGDEPRSDAIRQFIGSLLARAESRLSHVEAHLRHNGITYQRTGPSMFYSLDASEKKDEDKPDAVAPETRTLKFKVEMGPNGCLNISAMYGRCSAVRMSKMIKFISWVNYHNLEGVMEISSAASTVSFKYALLLDHIRDPDVRAFVDHAMSYVHTTAFKYFSGIRTMADCSARVSPKAAFKSCHKAKLELDVRSAPQTDQQRQQERARRRGQTGTIGGPPPDKKIADYTVDDVSSVLRVLGLSQFITRFRDNGVDGEFLVGLSDEDFSTHLGLQPLQTRKIRKYMQDVTEAQEDEAAPAAPAQSPPEPGDIVPTDVEAEQRRQQQQQQQQQQAQQQALQAADDDDPALLAALATMEAEDKKAMAEYEAKQASDAVATAEAMEVVEAAEAAEAAAVADAADAADAAAVADAAEAEEAG